MTSIRERIAATPSLSDAVRRRDLDEITSVLNSQGLMQSQPRFITARAVLTLCENGVDIISALESAGANNALANQAVKWLDKEAGLDIGDVGAQRLLHGLESVGVLKTEWVAQLIALSIRPVIVDRLAVESEIFNKNGTLKNG